MVAKSPVSVLDMIERLGNVRAVFFIAVLANLLRAFLEGVVITAGKQNSQH
jgi:hypothetical protein